MTENASSGTCPECRVPVNIQGDGTLFPHPRGGTTSAGPCEGGGTRPASDG